MVAAALLWNKSVTCFGSMRMTSASTNDSFETACTSETTSSAPRVPSPSHALFPPDSSPSLLSSPLPLSPHPLLVLTSGILNAFLLAYVFCPAHLCMLCCMCVRNSARIRLSLRPSRSSASRGGGRSGVRQGDQLEQTSIVATEPNLLDSPHS